MIIISMAPNLSSPHVPPWKLYIMYLLAVETIATNTYTHAYVYTQTCTHSIAYCIQKIMDPLKPILYPSIIRLWLCDLHMSDQESWGCLLSCLCKSPVTWS